MPVEIMAAQTVAGSAGAFQSTTVNPDHTVTFRYQDATAVKAELALEGAGPNLPMFGKRRRAATSTTASRGLTCTTRG